MKRSYPSVIVGVVLAGIAFLWSTGIIISRSWPLGQDEKAGQKVIRLLHWQLEPGYREALQEVIDDYNALPHVQQAKVEVRQIGISERVYGQYLNVHLISGTAPDLSVWGQSHLVTTGATGKFYESLGTFAELPNPYHAPQYLPKDLDPELARFLISAPWRETFLDGMLNGYDYSLKNYYAAPISTFGTTRVFINKSLLRKVKTFLREAMAEPPYAPWVEATRLRTRLNKTEGYLPLEERTLTWVNSDQPPHTLGQLLLLCAAVQEYALQFGLPNLVPIAGSEATAKAFRDAYLVPFTAEISRGLDFDLSGGSDQLETWVGLAQGRWSFESPSVEAYHEVIRELAQQFPAGFLGLDREQANRRFVLGNALMIATGGFDAEGIYLASQARTNPEDRFEVTIIPFPLPAVGERWAEHVAGPASEVSFVYGVPLAIYRRSPNKLWALDFLQYLTSLPVNERFNQRAGWLPYTVGAKPSERMAPFMPNPVGIHNSTRLNTILRMENNLPASTYQNQLWQYATGAKPYPAFARDVEEALDNPRNGIDRIWYQEWRRDVDNVRNRERGIDLQEFSLRLSNPGEVYLNDPRHRILVFEAILQRHGQRIRWLHDHTNGREPFPEF